MSIKKSLRTILIISSIIPVVIVSVVAQGLLSHRLIQIQESNLMQAAELNRSGLEAMIETHKTDWNAVHDSSVKTLIGSENQADSLLSDTVNSLLYDRKKINPYRRSLTLYNKDRQAVASSDNIIEMTANQLNSVLYKPPKRRLVGVSGFIDNAIEIGYPVLNDDFLQPTVGLHSQYIKYILF